MANIKELAIAMGRIKQANLTTRVADANLVGIRSRTFAAMDLVVGKETDKDDVGSGNEFATNAYVTSLSASASLDKYLSSEWAAIAFGFALGNVVTTTAGSGYKHTITFKDGTGSDDNNLPATTIAQRIRTGSDAVIEEALLGVVFNTLTLNLGTSPTRDSATLAAGLVGTGQFAKPSGVSSWPAALTEHLLTSGSAQVTLLGNNYTTLKTLFSVELSVNNDLREDTAYFPGSGSQAVGSQQAAIKGRMEYGNGRTVTASIKARLTKDSPEFAAMTALTEGTMVINCVGAQIGAGPETHRMQITLHRVQIGQITKSETSGIVDITAPIELFKHASNGVITVEVWNELAAVA